MTRVFSPLARLTLTIAALLALPGILAATSPNETEVDQKLQEVFGASVWDLSAEFQEVLRNLIRSLYFSEPADGDFNPDDFEANASNEVHAMAAVTAQGILDEWCMSMDEQFWKDPSTGEIDESAGEYWSWIYYTGNFWEINPLFFPNDNFAGDGIPNLLKYVLGLDPRFDGRRCLPRPVVKEHDGVDYLAITFLRPKWVRDVHLVLESSNDLVNWQEHCAPAVLTEDLPEGYPEHYEQVWMLDPIPFDQHARRFLRLQAVFYGGFVDDDPGLGKRLTRQLLAEDPNLSVEDVRYIGHYLASGCFRDGIAHGFVGYDENDEIIWSLDEGIVLTTGRASKWNEREHVNDESNNTIGGDPQLNVWMSQQGMPSFSGSGSGFESSQDASVLEIDFTPKHNRVRLRFLFASEEYYEAQHPHNDAMAIFLGRYDESKPAGVDWEAAGVPGGNIALLPAIDPPDVPETTSRAVAVYNIGEVYHRNPRLRHYMDGFVNNSQMPHHHNPEKPDAPPFDVSYSGFTIASEAIGAVIPNEPHVLRIVVADGGDGNYDAAAFIERSSFYSFHVEEN